MLYRRLGKTELQVSAVGLGCWNLGNQWGELSDAEATAIVDAAVAGGITLYDVAESYGIPNGCSELRVGAALAGRREGQVLVSKIGNWGMRTGGGVPKTSTDLIRLCGHACCGRLQTRTIEVMLCHEGDIEDPSVYIAGFRALRDEGFIGHYGISTNSLEVLRRFYEMSDGECAVVEFDYSLINRAPEADFIPYCQEHDLGLLARGPMAKGLLSGRYDTSTVFTDSVRLGWNAGESNRADFERRLERVQAVRTVAGSDLPQTALRYVLSHPAAPVAIPGATSPAQVAANCAAAAALLDPTTYHKLQTLD